MRSTVTAAALGLLLATATATATAAPARAEGEVSIPFTKARLPNEMRVILHEDHSVPIVVVDVSYDVGSADEVRGRTGFAHLF